MADTADDAVASMEVVNQAAIQAARQAVTAPSRKPTGKCKWCDDPVGPGLVFCDADCLEDHNLRQRAASMSKR